MNRFEELEAFVAVVDYKGFGNAAEKLGIVKSMVSRRVSELERRLAVQLLQRTTRRQTLTDAGREFYPRAAQLLCDLQDAEQSVSRGQTSISGRIRLALPLGFGVRQLARPISDFLTRFPEIRIDVDLNDRRVDLIEENIDLAIRVGEMESSTLIARKLANVHFAVCASPEYLSVHGAPGHPSELVEHEVLVYSNVSVGRQWSYQQGGKQVSPRMKYRLTANNGEFLAAVASCGQAIVSGPMALLEGYIQSGALVRILQDYPHPEAGMYAVYPPGRLVAGRVKMLSDALYDHFRDRVI
jgi:DNA-binding transcriptional LysR family regulator